MTVPLYLIVASLYVAEIIVPKAVTDFAAEFVPASRFILHIGGLAENVSGFVDRGDDQNWINVPVSLLGADYIERAQNNADVSDDRGTSLLIEVDVTDGTVLYMFIHDDQPNTPFPWMNAADFGSDWVDSGLDVFYAFNNTHFDIWRTVGPLAGGTYNFRQMPVDSSFYGIAALTVPEPGTLALLGIGLAGMGLMRRRRNV